MKTLNKEDIELLRRRVHNPCSIQCHTKNDCDFCCCMELEAYEHFRQEVFDHNLAGILHLIVEYDQAKQAVEDAEKKLIKAIGDARQVISEDDFRAIISS